MNFTKYLSGQHNMQSAIITGKTRHVPFININLSNIPINISINKYQYINIYICSSSFLPRSENLIHLVTKDEEVAAGNDLIAMSKHMSETLVTTTTKE